MLLVFAHTVDAEGATNGVPVPNDLISPQSTWGEETNGFRAGVNWELSSKMEVRFIVLTSKTNVWWNYVAPPGKKFAKFELRNARGILLTPINGDKLDGELPQRILSEDLPQRPAIGHHARTIDNPLLLDAGSPGLFRDVVIQNVYRIEQEGDYTLTGCIAIYEFAPDRQSVSRIDLPCVTVKLHLTANKPEAK
jgi:hypothetical protein